MTIPRLPSDAALRGMRAVDAPDSAARQRPESSAAAKTFPLDLGEFDPVLIEAYRAMSPVQKLLAVDAMWQSVRALVLESIRAQHPEWSEARVDRETARRMSHATA